MERKQRNRYKEINSDLEFLNQKVNEYEKYFLFGVPEEYPIELYNALSDYFKKIQTVEKAYLSCIVSEAEPIFVLVIDSHSPAEILISEVIQFCQPLIKDISLNITMHDSKLGKAASEGKYPFFIRDTDESASYQVWNYLKPHETEKDMYGWASLYAIGKNKKGELFVFDLYSDRFLHALHNDKLQDNYWMSAGTSLFVQSFYNSENRRKRKVIAHSIDASEILTVLKSKAVYNSASKIKRILDLRQKKHKIIITYTIMSMTQEEKRTITIFDDIQNYDSLYACLKSYMDYSKNICPYCGKYMKNGICSECKGARQAVEESDRFYKENYIQLVIFVLISLISFVLSYFLDYILLRLLFLGLGITTLLWACHVLNKIRHKKKTSA